MLVASGQGVTEVSIPSHIATAAASRGAMPGPAAAWDSLPPRKPASSA